MMYFRIQSLLGIAVVGTVLATSAHAQQMKGYSFDKQNRGQLAVAMKQIESSGHSAGTGNTTFICGGGEATATANNTCVILNNSDGVVTTDQMSEGDQSAQISEETNVSGTSGADEVLSTLAQ